MPPKNSLSRRELYARDPNLRNRSLILAQKIDDLKKDPQFKEFSGALYKAIVNVRFIGRNDRRERRRLVANALLAMAYEFDEIKTDTGLNAKEVYRVLKLFHRCRLLVVKTRVIDRRGKCETVYKMFIPTDRLKTVADTLNAQRSTKRALKLNAADKPTQPNKRKK